MASKEKWMVWWSGRQADPRMSHAPMPVMMYGWVDCPSTLLLLPSRRSPDPSTSEAAAAMCLLDLKDSRCESAPSPCGNLPYHGQQYGNLSFQSACQVRLGWQHSQPGILVDDLPHQLAQHLLVVHHSLTAKQRSGQVRGREGKGREIGSMYGPQVSIYAGEGKGREGKGRRAGGFIHIQHSANKRTSGSDSSERMSDPSPAGTAVALTLRPSAALRILRYAAARNCHISSCTKKHHAEETADTILHRLKGLSRVDRSRTHSLCMYSG